MTREPKPIAIEDMAADLGIAESDAMKMLQSESAQIVMDYRGRPSAPAAYIGRLSARDDYFPAVCRAIASEGLGHTARLVRLLAFVHRVVGADRHLAATRAFVSGQRIPDYCIGGLVCDDFSLGGSLGLLTRQIGRSPETDGPVAAGHLRRLHSRRVASRFIQPRQIGQRDRYVGMVGAESVLQD